MCLNYYYYYYYITLTKDEKKNKLNQVPVWFVCVLFFSIEIFSRGRAGKQKID